MDHWVVKLDDGSELHEKDFVRTPGNPPWLQLKKYVKDNNRSISSLTIKVGNLSSKCQKKDAKAYFFARKSMGYISGSQRHCLGHGWLDDNKVRIVWCSGDSYSETELRPRENCEDWLIHAS